MYPRIVIVVCGLCTPGALLALGQTEVLEQNTRSSSESKKSDPAPDAKNEEKSAKRKVDVRALAAVVAIRGSDHLLEFRAIREELKLTDRQIAAIDRLATNKFSLQRSMLEAKGNAAVGEPKPNAVAVLNDLRTRSAEEVAQILTPTQHKRLNQIALQAGGPLAFTSNDEIMGLMDLSDDQLLLIAEIKANLERIELEIGAERSKLLSQRVAPEPDKKKAEPNRQAKDAPWILFRVSEESWRKIEACESKLLASEVQTRRAVDKVLSVLQRRVLKAAYGSDFDFERLASGRADGGKKSKDAR